MIPLMLRPLQPPGAGEDDTPRQDRARGSGAFGNLLAELDTLTSGRQTPACGPSLEGADEEVCRGPAKALAETSNDAGSARKTHSRRPSLLDFTRSLPLCSPAVETGKSSDSPERAPPEGTAAAASLPPATPPATAGIPTTMIAAMIPTAPMIQAVPTSPTRDDPAGGGHAGDVDLAALAAAPGYEDAPAPLPRAQIMLRETHFAPVLASESRSPQPTETPPADTRPMDMDEVGATLADTAKPTGKKVGPASIAPESGQPASPNARPPATAPPKVEAPDTPPARAAEPKVASARAELADAVPPKVRPLEPRLALAVTGADQPTETPQRVLVPAMERPSSDSPHSRMSSDWEERSDVSKMPFGPGPGLAPGPIASERAEKPAPARSPSLPLPAPLAAAPEPPAATPLSTSTVLPLSSPPAVQVAAAVAEASLTASARPVTSEAAAGGPVRVLEIQLNPVELGLVTVRLRMGRNGLEIQVNAARAETARLIEQDRALLLASLAGPDGVPLELSIGRHGMSTGLTGYDAPRESAAHQSAPDAPEADDFDPNARRRRQPNEHPSDSSADGNTAG